VNTEEAQQFCRQIMEESENAGKRYGPIKSRHELLGIMHEEFSEVCDAIHHNKSKDQLVEELIQLAAMCLRGAIEVELKPKEHYALR